MQLNFTEEELKFRDEVRQLLNDELTPEIIAGNKKTTTALGNNEAAMAWQGILNKRGWGASAAWAGRHIGQGATGHPRRICLHGKLLC